MADRFGNLPFPVEVVTPPSPGVEDAEAAGDPSLRPLAEYLKACLNAHAQAAWQGVAPTLQAVRIAYTHDPRESFSDAKLPALFVFRSSSEATDRMAEDWLTEPSTVTVLWVLPSGQQNVMRNRTPFGNAVRKVIARSLFRERDPSYQRVGDADTTALDAAEDLEAILLSTATSTSPTSFEASDFDGVIGAGAILPNRPIAIRLGGAPADYVDGSTVTVVGESVAGPALPVSQTFTIDGSTVPTTLSGGSALSRVTRVDFDAQATVDGTISIGTGEFIGRGSVVRRFTGFLKWMVGKSQWSALHVDLDGKQSVAEYPMFETLVNVWDKLTVDVDQFDQPSAAAAAVLYPDGETFSDVGVYE